MNPKEQIGDANGDVATLVDEFLVEQQTLTAVERFSLHHERNGHSSREKFYSALMPARSPDAGEQYAFRVDLDACSGCKACVAGCHSLNGLDDNETWRDVGILHGIAEEKTFQQTITSACHHCVDPGCLSGCPVKAYDKDAITGIVRHLDDQCIGCQYCIMKCPYEAPKYSKRLGIVRKCDMCVNRLASGEAPACVQSCPNNAIQIVLVNKSEIKKEFGNGQTKNRFLPDSPNPNITLPTTHYFSRLKAKSAVAADHNVPRLDNPHWPLVVMLVVTQAAAGMFLAASFVPGTRVLFLPAFLLLMIGLAAAPLHLGRPLKSWRVFLGWRTSWLSREIIAFNLLAPLAALLTLVMWMPWIDHQLPQIRNWIAPLARFQFPLVIGVAVGALGAVFVSAMVYIDTKRPCWAPRYSFGNFFGTTLLLGQTFSAFVFAVTGASKLTLCFTLASLFLRLALVLWRWTDFRAALKNRKSVTHLNARATDELISWVFPCQAWLLVVATGFDLLAIANISMAALWAGGAAVGTMASEIVARYTFFRAGAGKKMPGGIEA